MTVPTYDRAYGERVVKLMSAGASKREAAERLGLPERLLDKWAAAHPEFAAAVEEGAWLTPGWWERQGRLNLRNSRFDAKGWFDQMKNRFPADWRDRHEVEASVTTKPTSRIEEWVRGRQSRAGSLNTEEAAMPGPGRKWKKGQSGNPTGRQPGTGVVERQPAALAEHLPAVLDRLVRQALDGDVQAMKLLLERVLPPYRPIDRPLELGPLPPGAGPKLRAILEQVTTGVIGLNEAERLIGLLSGATALASRVEYHDPVAHVEEPDEQGGACTWSTDYRGLVVVHTRWQQYADRGTYFRDRYGVNHLAALPRGGIVGVVELVDCVRVVRVGQPG